MKTASGATAVQIVWSSARGSRKIEHLGSAHDEQQLAALRAAGEEKITAGQTVLDLGVVEPAPVGPLPITASRMAVLWDALDGAYRRLRFDAATGTDVVFRDLVLARIIEPTSKLDSLRVIRPGVSGDSLCLLERGSNDGNVEVHAGAEGSGVGDGRGCA